MSYSFWFIKIYPSAVINVCDSKIYSINCALWCNTVINSKRIYAELDLHSRITYEITRALIFNFGRNARLMTRMLQFIDDYDMTKELSWASWIDRRKANSVARSRGLAFFFLALTYFSFLQDGFRRRISPIGGRFVAQLWSYRGRDIASQAARFARIYAS